MRCLDHTDMAALMGAVTIMACAGFFFAYLGIERDLPVGTPSMGFLQEELAKAIDEAVVTPSGLADERNRTQAALGKTIVGLAQLHARKTSLISDLAGRAADQEELGRLLVAGNVRFERQLAVRQADYGRAVVAATQAIERAAGEPAASRETILAAAAARAAAERTAPAPAAVITRDPSWGFGSIGDGALLPVMVLGAGAFILVLGGIGMTGAVFSTRTIAAHCDEVHKDVMVEMLVSDETPYEVTHCSAFDGGPITCDKRCRRWPRAFERPLAHAA